MDDCSAHPDAVAQANAREQPDENFMYQRGVQHMQASVKQACRPMVTSMALWLHVTGFLVF